MNSVAQNHTGEVDRMVAKGAGCTFLLVNIRENDTRKREGERKILN